MKRGMVSLVLVLMAATAMWARTSDDPVVIQTGDEPMVWMGPQRGSYMGVHTSDVTKDRLDALKMKEETGVEVVGVDQDAPAGKAGIKEHDVIVTLNGTKVESEEQLRRIVREIPPGREVTVGLMRNGQPMTVKLTLADRQKVFKQRMAWDSDAAVAPIPPMPPMVPEMDIPAINVVVNTTSRTGLMVENLTPQLAEFLGVKGGRGGVMVRSVEKGSVAEGAGFKAGDVILSIDKEQVSDMGDFRRATRSHSGATPFTVMRDKKEQTLTMKLPERRRGELRKEDFGGFNFDIDTEGLAQMAQLQKFEFKFDEKKMKEFQKQMEKMSKDIEKKMEKIRFEWNEE